MKRKTVTTFIAGTFVAVGLSGGYIYSNVPLEIHKKQSTFIDIKWKLKKFVYNKSSDKVTFYCGCKYITRKKINRASCGYIPRRETRRSRQVEWEHVYPISRFGKTRPCWFKAKSLKVNPREYCAKNDNKYRLAENDSINLVPSVGELNLIRSNHSFGLVIGEERRFGACDFEDKNKITEPRKSIRGDIARIWAYMERVHGVPISLKEKGMLRQWNKSDPKTKKEQKLWNDKLRMMKNETN